MSEGKCHTGLEDVTGKRVQEDEQRRKRQVVGN